MGSIASDNQGNIGLGFSASSSSINPQIRYAGRLTTDPLNTLSGEQHLFDGDRQPECHRQSLGRLQRSHSRSGGRLHVLLHERILPDDVSFNWRTRIGYFKFLGCTAPQKGTAILLSRACTGGAAISNAFSNDRRQRLRCNAYPTAPTTRYQRPARTVIRLRRPESGARTGTSPFTNGQITNVHRLLWGPVQVPHRMRPALARLQRRYRRSYAGGGLPN